MHCQQWKIRTEENKMEKLDYFRKKYKQSE